MSEPRNLPSSIQDILEGQETEVSIHPSGQCAQARILGIAETRDKIMEAVGAAASVRAPTMTRDQLLDLINKHIYMEMPQGQGEHSDRVLLTNYAAAAIIAEIDRQARTIVAAAERKEVMPPGSDSRPTQANDTAPPTAGPIPEAGAPSTHAMQAARRIEDLHVHPETSHEEFIKLMATIIDAEYLAAAPSPQPPAPAEGGTDVAGLVDALDALTSNPKHAKVDPEGLAQRCRDALTAQAAEITEANEQIAATERAGIAMAKEVDRLTAALAAKEADIERLRSDAPGTPNARLKWIGDWAVSHGLCLGVEAQAPEKFVIERIATLEAALQKIIDLQDRSFVGGESLIMRAITIARAALSGKEPQQP